MHIDSEADKIRMLIVIRTTFPPPLALLFFFLFTTEDVLLRSLTHTSMPARFSHSYNAYLYTHAWIFMMWKWNCGGKKWNSCTCVRVRTHTHTPPCMDSIASMLVIMTPQEVKRNSGCPAVEYTVEEYERRMLEVS